MFESVRPQIFIGPFFGSGAVSVFTCAVRVGLIAAPPGLVYEQQNNTRRNPMRKVFLALVSGAMLSGAAIADDVKIGIILGFTGPIESLTPAMAAGAELAIAEVNASG